MRGGEGFLSKNYIPKNNTESARGVGYSHLAVAIIMQALKDYRYYLHHPKARDRNTHMVRLRKFFKSQWFDALYPLPDMDKYEFFQKFFKEDIFK